MKKKLICLSFIILSMIALLSGCSGSSSLKNGYYAAEMASFNQGWKEYLLIQVKNDSIISVEYNAKNESGFLKSWDNNYMKNMGEECNTYPNKYTREYIQQLLTEQTDISVDAISGATHSGDNFAKLVQAVLQQAHNGNTDVAIVE